MKTRTILGVLFALFIFTTACQKKDDVQPAVKQENQDLKKTVPVDQVRKIVGIWREELAEEPFTHFNRININLPNEYGDGEIMFREAVKKADGQGYDQVNTILGEYFTYETDKASIPNIADLEANYGELVCGVGMSFDDGSYYNYFAFRKVPDGQNIPNLYLIDNSYDGSSDPSPRIFIGDH